MKRKSSSLFQLKGGNITPITNMKKHLNQYWLWMIYAAEIPKKP